MFRCNYRNAHRYVYRCRRCYINRYRHKSKYLYINTATIDIFDKCSIDKCECFDADVIIAFYRTFFVGPIDIIFEICIKIFIDAVIVLIIYVELIDIINYINGNKHFYHISRYAKFFI